MPHEKGPDTGSVTVDHRKALTITPGGKLDTFQIGNTLKIHKRKGLLDGCADADMTKSTRKHPKIHWTQLAANGASSGSAHRHNGRQAGEHKNDSLMLDVKRRQVKVILIDVLRTEEGQRYLGSCVSDTNEKMQSPFKEEPRERRRERRSLELHSAVRRRISTPDNDQTKISPLKLSNSLSPDSVRADKNDMHLSKGVRSPSSKRCRRFNNSLKHAEPAASDEEQFTPLKQRDFSPNKESHNLFSDHTQPLDENELYQDESPRPTSIRTLHSEGSDSEQISESLNPALQTPLLVKQPSQSHKLEHQDSESKDVPAQPNTGESEVQECAEVTENGGKIEQNREKEVHKEKILHQNGEVLDEGGGARGSVLRLSTGVPEGQLTDEPKSIQTAGSADKHILVSELIEVRQTSKPQPPEPIVLSSEEEEEEEENETSLIQALEGAIDPHRQHKPVETIEKTKDPEAHVLPSDLNNQGSRFEDSDLSGCPVMELQFSGLYLGTLCALCNGLVKITDDKITISFKDSLGSEVKASLATAHVHKYSVWDGLMVRDSNLVKKNEVPPPSILLLWLAEVQARHLFSDLSVLQPEARPAEGSTCVVLCVCESLNGVQGALLASIMDFVGLRHGNSELLSPLSHADSLKLLQNCRDSNTLQLLLPKSEANTVSCESGTAPAPANTTTASAKDTDTQPDSRAYTLCQIRGHSAYSVSLTHKPGADWTPYRHCGPRRLIQFPPPPSKGAITVTTEDLECLDSGEFLNDVIIDFYLKYLLVQKAPHASVRRSHIFSSFFYKQLTRRDNANEDSTSTPAQLRRHQRVRTWTRHVDIFEKDFLFVPVNQEAHWYLVVVCFPGLDEPQSVERSGQGHDRTENTSESTAQSESQHRDEDINSDENSSVSAPGPPTCTESTCKRRTVCKRPCILIMDSLKLSVHERIFKLLREYLQAEWEVKRGGYRDFSAERMVGSHCRVPLQDNSSDCGLYLLQYAESFLQDPVVNFDLPLKLDRWFPRQKVREKREEIRELVLHLYRFQQGSLGNESSEDGKEKGNIV